MKLRYIGGGAFVVGLPARDLTAQEVKLYGAQRLLDTGLYAEIKPKAKAEKPAEEISMEVNNGY
jgi:hypothetical protein